MRYDNLGIMLGRKCTANCSMCCIEANMSCNEELNKEKLKEFILSSQNLEKITSIDFTGGEAFLYYETLCELIKLSKDIGKYSTVITNGFWAKDYDITKNKIKELKEIGLSTLGISFDEFHEEYIPLENIRNIIRACKEQEMPLSVQTVILKDSTFRWMNNLGDDLKGVEILFINCGEVGRTKSCISRDRIIKNKDLDNQMCQKGGSFVVDYNGELKPCCNPHIFDCDIKIGNIYNDIDTVSDALNKIENNNFLKVLRNKGFDIFIDVIREHKIIELPNKVSSACELCRLISQNDVLNKVWPYVVEVLKKDNNCKVV